MIGKLAFEYCNKPLQLQVMKSASGFYIGTFDNDGPCSRESCEYWGKEIDAESALKNGEWTQLAI